MFKHLLFAGFFLFSLQLVAEELSSIQYDTIDIEGNYSQAPSAIDNLKKLRAQLEKQNEMMVKKKIEDMRLKQELLLMKKVQKAFEKNLASVDSIN